MSLFSAHFFQDRFNFKEIDETMDSALRTAAQQPYYFYVFMQRYTYFNAYASAVIARLASSIGLSRYLFRNHELLVLEESDRGLEIAAQIMAAAADEGTDRKPVHRLLAQLLLKTIGDYAHLSVEERNNIAQPPQWLIDISNSLVANYEGKPNNLEALVKAIGFHVASEILGDREYSLIDKIIRFDYKNIGFDKYLRLEARPTKIQGHFYDPWCWVVMHGKHEGSAAECEHLACAIRALNMTVRYCNEPQENITDWVLNGFQAFVNLQQQLFYEIHRENLELMDSTKGSSASKNLPLSSHH